MQTIEILLNGKNVEIDLENLKDEELACYINEETGEHYFTFEGAKKAAEKQGKRLMTKEEQQWLCEKPRIWDYKLKGRVFVVLTPDESFGNIFFPAGGWYNYLNDVLIGHGDDGFYWGLIQDCSYGCACYIYNRGAGTIPHSQTSGFSVRCVKDIKIIDTN